jgi:hypothetical protein
MAIVTEISWNDMFAGKALPDSPARTAFREAVAEIAEKAKQTLPDCIGRVDSAVKIVLNGDVELLQDGTARVASQSNGTTKYFIVNGECECKDYPKAPSHWCKHRIAAGLAKRARTLAKTKLEQQSHGTSNGTTQPATEQAQVQPETAIPPVEAPIESEPIAVPVPLPEAKSSANVFVTIAGRKVQLTLRDHDEDSLLSRVERLLSRFPVEEEPESAPTPPENWCPIHHVQMKRYSNAKGSWFSHKTPEGTWCNGKKGK